MKIGARLYVLQLLRPTHSTMVSRIRPFVPLVAADVSYLVKPTRCCGDSLFQFHRRRYFSRRVALQRDELSVRNNGKSSPETHQRPKPPRSAPAKTSLRRVAVEAQRSRDGLRSPLASTSQLPSQTKVRHWSLIFGRDLYDSLLARPSILYR